MFLVYFVKDIFICFCKINFNKETFNKFNLEDNTDLYFKLVDI